MVNRFHEEMPDSSLTGKGTCFALYSLSPSKMWSAVKRQGAPFWLLCVYLIFEYVRPQTIWPALDVAPFAMMSLLGAAVALVIAPRDSGGTKSFATVLMVIFQVVILISSVQAYQPSESYKWFSLFFSWLVIYYLIVQIINTRVKFFLFMILYFLVNLKMAQHGFISWLANGFGFSSWGVSCAPGWFQNSGECGTQMAMIFPMWIYFIFSLGKYWPKNVRLLMWALPVMALGTVVATGSRGALLALVVASSFMVVKSQYRIRAIILLTLIGGVVFLVTPPEFKERFNEAGEDRTSQTRLMYWGHGIEILKEYPVLGVGYRNWIPYYSDHWPEDSPFQGVELPHNIFLEIGTELGWAGLVMYAILIVFTFVCNYRSRRAALIVDDRFLFYMAHGLDAALVAFLVSGQFVSVAYYPFFWINLAFSVSLRASVERVLKGRAMAVSSDAMHEGRTNNYMRDR